MRFVQFLFFRHALKQERENSDYDDFYVASLKDASDQYKSAKLIIEKIEEYLSEKGIQY